mgnify:CR=1 FL=1
MPILLDSVSLIHKGNHKIHHLCLSGKFLLLRLIKFMIRNNLSAGFYPTNEGHNMLHLYSPLHCHTQSDDINGVCHLSSFLKEITHRHTKRFTDFFDSRNSKLTTTLFCIFQCGIWNITNLWEPEKREVSFVCQIDNPSYCIHKNPAFPTIAVIIWALIKHDLRFEMQLPLL